MISSLSPSVKIQIMGGKGVKKNIAGCYQQTFGYKKFVDNAQQCLAFTPQANFPRHDLNFEGEGDGIKSRLPFKIFSTLHILSVHSSKQILERPEIHAVTDCYQSRFDFL